MRRLVLPHAGIAVGQVAEETAAIVRRRPDAEPSFPRETHGAAGVPKPGKEDRPQGKTNGETPATASSCVLGTAGSVPETGPPLRVAVGTGQVPPSLIVWRRGPFPWPVARWGLERTADAPSFAWPMHRLWEDWATLVSRWALENPVGQKPGRSESREDALNSGSRGSRWGGTPQLEERYSGA